MRQESCQGLYKLCIGHSNKGRTGYAFLIPVLANLLHFIDAAQNMRTPRKRVSACFLSDVIC